MRISLTTYTSLGFMIEDSLNDIDARIAALETAESDSQSSVISSDDEGSFSGYSCDSSSSEDSESSNEGEREEQVELTADEKRKLEFDKKAKDLSRKKHRQRLSDICFKYIVERCSLSDCIFRHCTLESLGEEERGELVRELHRKPFDAEIGVKVKQLNVPVCKTFSKQGECKFQKCRFWHIQTENDAKWAGCPFWCQTCRKAFTSDSQLREHVNGKVHKSNAVHL